MFLVVDSKRWRYSFLYTVGHPLMTLRGLTFSRSLFADTSKQYRTICLYKLSHKCDLHVYRCRQVKYVGGQSVAADECTRKTRRQYKWWRSINLLTACFRLIAYRKQLRVDHKQLKRDVMTVKTPWNKGTIVQLHLSVGIFTTSFSFFDCCFPVHVDKYSIKVPTTCTSFIIEAQKLLFCTYVFTPTCFDPLGSSSGDTMPVPG
jgi:hypothetical protein